ncbi:MAG TPA: TetR/AcrR family transcriptional regulator, partial [Homoserinimonas sp.]|nr:TetR/AcrR family transcriptional regulator [Homoserinimonas sp.]
VHVLRERFSTVFRIMAVLGAERPPMPSQRKVYSEIISECLAPDAARLNWPPEHVGHIIRLITFSAAFPQLNDGMEFSTEQLCSIVLYGVAGTTPCDIHSESN